MKSRFLLSSLALILSPWLNAMPDPGHAFAEVDGLVVVEAEHFAAQTHTEKRAWLTVSTEFTPTAEPDGDPSHAESASGGAYLEVLPDTRRTPEDTLIKGENITHQPGTMAVLGYPVRFTTPGRYYFWARTYSTGKEDNGLHVGLDDTWPASGERWQTTQRHGWHWDCRQRTPEVHAGVPMQLWLDVPTAGWHTVRVAMREDGVELDKFILARDPEFRPAGTGPDATTTSAPLPFPAHWGIPPEIQTMDYRPLPGGFGHGSGTLGAWIDQHLATDSERAAAGVTVSATDLALQGTDYYLDKQKWAAINPNRAKTASVQTLVPAGNSRFHITLHAVGESDGRSTYEVLLGGRSLGAWSVPLSTEMFEEGPAFNRTWENVTVNEGESLEIRAAIGSSDGREYARARWSKIVFTPVDGDPGKVSAVTANSSSSAKPAPPAGVLILPRQPDAEPQATISGELKQWHTVILDLAGPYAHERDVVPNAFTDYAFDVTFTHASGEPTYRVPGYFAADGDAANSGAESGTVWRAHLSPDKTGEWTYTVHFRRGPNAATYEGGKLLAPYDGLTGSFTITATDKTAPDFRARGRLAYTGERYLRFAGDGTVFLKAGADAPETYLAYADFDNTETRKPNVPLKTWAPHLRDWHEGDPIWADGRGKGIIGSLNYLSAKGANSFSFLTYNAGGDGDNVWPFVERDDKFHYDVSKLAQWEIVFAHAQRLGLYLHFKLQENENDDHRAGGWRRHKYIPEAMDAGETGPERRLYFRELIARFGHHLALNWNFGEENTQSTAEQLAMFDYVAALDPYGHHRVIHTFPQHQIQVYPELIGDRSNLTGISAQNPWKQTHAWTHRWIEESAATGRQWVVANDEQNPATFGVPPDPGYQGFSGIAGEGDEAFDLHGIRKYTLWGNLMAGGAGVEYYFGYRLPENDLLCEDLRSRDQSWDYCRHALAFFAALPVDLAKLAPDDPRVGTEPGANGNWCLADPNGSVFVIYLPEGGEAKLDLTDQSGTYTVSWFNPRTGEPGQGTVATVKAGTTVALGTARTDPTEDWALLVQGR